MSYFSCSWHNISTEKVYFIAYPEVAPIIPNIAAKGDTDTSLSSGMESAFDWVLPAGVFRTLPRTEAFRFKPWFDRCEARERWLACICRLNRAPGMGTGSGSVSPKMQSHGWKIMSSKPMDSNHPRNVEELDMVCVPIFYFWTIVWLKLNVGMIDRKSYEKLPRQVPIFTFKRFFGVYHYGCCKNIGAISDLVLLRLKLIQKVANLGKTSKYHTFCIHFKSSCCFCLILQNTYVG